MITPTLKTLETALELPRPDARLIKRLGKACDDPDALRAVIEKHCPETDAYARTCYSDPYRSYMWRVTLALHAIDRIVGTCGVEAIGEGSHADGYAPPYEYLNTGDSYAATLVYKRETDRLFVGSWCAVVESEFSEDGCDHS